MKIVNKLLNTQYYINIVWQKYVNNKEINDTFTVSDRWYVIFERSLKIVLYNQYEMVCVCDYLHSAVLLCSWMFQSLCYFGPLNLNEFMIWITLISHTTFTKHLKLFQLKYVSMAVILDPVWSSRKITIFSTINIHTPSLSYIL